MRVAKELLFWTIIGVLALVAIAWVFAGEIARFYDDLMDDRRCR